MLHILFEHKSAVTLNFGIAYCLVNLHFTTSGLIFPVNRTSSFKSAKMLKRVYNGLTNGTTNVTRRLRENNWWKIIYGYCD